MPSDLLIGTFGDSITYGAGVGNHSWPSRLQERLQRTYGSRLRVLNGAVRASSADFAAVRATGFEAAPLAAAAPAC